MFLCLFSDQLQKCLGALQIADAGDANCASAVEQTLSLLETQGQLFITQHIAWQVGTLLRLLRFTADVGFIASSQRRWHGTLEKS